MKNPDSKTTPPITVPQFEIRGLLVEGEDFKPATDADADVWGLYVTHAGSLPMHVRDFPSRAAANVALRGLTPEKAGPNNISPDDAAIFGAAVSLYEASKLAATVDDISEAYHGGDEFMRQIFRVANLFENWACENVDFAATPEVWPYLLEDKFGDACIEAVGLLRLRSFSKTECLAVAELLKLPLVKA